MDLWVVILYFVIEYSAILLISVAHTIPSLALGSTFSWLRVLRHTLITIGIGFFYLFCF